MKSLEGLRLYNSMADIKVDAENRAEARAVNRTYREMGGNPDKGIRVQFGVKHIPSLLSQAKMRARNKGLYESHGKVRKATEVWFQFGTKEQRIRAVLGLMDSTMPKVGCCRCKRELTSLWCGACAIDFR